MAPAAQDSPAARPMLHAVFGAAVALLLALSPLPVYAQGIVAVVNDEPISRFDVEQRMRFIALTTKQQPSEALNKEALEMLIDERIQTQQGKKLKITVDEAEVSKAIGEMAQRNNMDEAKLTAAFAQMGVNIATLKNRIRATLAWQQVVREKFRYEVMVARSAIERESQGAGAASSGGEGGAQLELHQIRLDVPSNAGDAAVAQRLAEAEKLRSSFKSCASISSLVKNVSGASVRNLGPKSASDMAQPARTLLMNAKVGQMTPPNVTGDGIELYAVCGKTAASGDDSPSKDAAAQKIQNEFQIRAKKLMRDLRQEAFIEYR